VVETIGIALYTMGKCDSYETAMQKAKELWNTRLSV
jgi:anthranilate phosphoribosyltransferase